MGPREFIVLISMLTALTALAIDMMLPAFSSMRAELGMSEDSSSLGLVVSAFFMGLGLGQLIWGPLSDALGRKPILWLGLAVYAAAALGAALSPSFVALLTWRVVGGLGAGAVRVVALGVVRDRYRGDQMAKVLSYVMAVFILVPVIAPSVGAAVLVVGTWRTVFGVFIVGAVLAAAWSTRLPETLPPERRIPLDLSKLVTALLVVVRSRFAMGLTIAQAAAFGFFASYLGTSELIIGDVFGLGSWFPVIFGASALVMGAGLLLNPRLLDRFLLRPWIRIVLNAYVAVVAAFAILALATGGSPPFWLFAVSLVAILFVQGFVIPNLNSAAMMPMGHLAGTAAAVMGSIVTLGGAAIGATIDRAYDGTILPLALAAGLLAVTGYVAYRWADAAWVRSADRELFATSE